MIEVIVVIFRSCNQTFFAVKIIKYREKFFFVGDPESKPWNLKLRIFPVENIHILVEVNSSIFQGFPLGRPVK